MNRPHFPHVVRMRPSLGGSSRQCRRSQFVQRRGTAVAAAPIRKCSMIASRWAAMPARSSGVNAPSGTRFEQAEFHQQVLRLVTVADYYLGELKW
jgi:hypothetical protein